ncbi:MAG: peptidylprolyl isomerase [Clostridiales bacterium]|nr:peptidylprolyl isomerase [Clostridiales bacterium]
MRKYTKFMLFVFVVTLLLTGCGTKEKAGKTGDYLSGKHNVEIEIADYGTISVELDADKAPITVTNFVNLTKDGFYDGLTFHRIIEGFMIQGGDPNGNGTGGSEETIKGEFSSNGVDNPLSHTRGAISMARSMDKDSASSQFFIVHEDSTFLDGDYAVFGYVTEGIEIVDEICADTPVLDNNGTVNSADQPVITSVKVID